MYQKLRECFLLAIFTLPTFAAAQDYQYQNGTYFDMGVASKTFKKVLFAVPSDLYNFAVDPFLYPDKSLTALGIVGGLVLVDKPTTTFYQENIESNINYSLDTIFPNSGMTKLMRRGADSWLTYGMAFSYLGGVAFGDERTQAAALLAIKATAYSYAISHVILKTLTGRQRPMDDLKNCTDSRSIYHTCDPYDFGNWHWPPTFNTEQDGTSMPSFHTTMYFSVARVVAEVYDSYWLPYLGAGVLFASAIKGHQHWVSDLVAGGIIGTWIGHEVVYSYTKNAQGERAQTYTISPTPYGFVVSIAF
ncbi:phosphatase PAP2 family protein [Sulfurimonas sp. HSL1-6]|uniref:phosphatase PAP2 family protein n=1 Tax=Thiomicrolovo immobilis TaxID=3131935 RepID=UPI0031F8E815